jgi:hypothetical protein
LKPVDLVFNEADALSEQLATRVFDDEPCVMEGCPRRVDPEQGRDKRGPAGDGEAEDSPSY